MSRNTVKVTKQDGNKVTIQEANYTVQLTEETVKVVNVGTKIDQDRTHVHSQGSPSSTWTVTHSLNKKPSVTVVNSADVVVIGEIEYLDNNRVELTFSSAFSGKAYFN